MIQTLTLYLHFSRYVARVLLKEEIFYYVLLERLAEVFHRLNMPWIFKSSYDKANRTSIHSFRGIGLQEGLKVLEEVKNSYEIAIVTDVHTPEEAVAAAEVCEVLQIPAFLARQTDLLIAAGRTGKTVEIKKGQFMSPYDMRYAVEKVREAGSDKVWLVERGTFFGYRDLVVDMRSIPIMQSFGVPVGFDATHSVQKPGGSEGSSGGDRAFIPSLASAAVAAGANFIFIEAHPCPQEALSDKETQIPLNQLFSILQRLQTIREVVSNPKQEMAYAR